MVFNGDHHRKSTRLSGYDYSQPGAYFITICTFQRSCLFGDITDGDMFLNTLGCIVDEEILRTETIRQEVKLDHYVIMPNHIHIILWIKRNNSFVGAHGRAPLRVRKPQSIGALIAGLKSASTKRINQIRETQGNPVWQRNYHDHVIRDEADLNKHRGYILNNPAKWEEDNEYHL